MYNLLDEAWQPALVAADGETERAGVLRLVAEAHRYADLLVETPTQRPALYRQLLLPFVLDALHELLPRDAEAWAALFRRGRFTERQTERLLGYGEEHRARFGLFDTVHPFAQVPGLHTAKGETKSATALVATAAQGNNVPLFSSRTDGDELRLDPGEAARWLLHTHCWDTGAIKTGAVGDRQAKQGKTTGNPVGPLGSLGVVMPRGRTLFETLLLNLPFKKRVLPEDAPQWRCADITHRRCADGTAHRPCAATPAWQQRPATGLLDLWTWQSRRALLLPERDGDGGLYVARVVLAGGDRLELTPDDEPHTAWVIDTRTTAHHRRRPTTGRAGTEPAPGEGPASGAADGAALKRPLRHVTGRAGWRGLNALLAFAHAPEVPDPSARSAGRRHETTQLLMTLAEARDELDPEYPLRLDLTGMTYGTKLGHVEDSFHDEVPLPLAALRYDGPVRAALLEAVLHAEELAGAVNRLDGHLRRAAGAEPVPPLAWQQPGERLLALLGPLVLALLRDLRHVGEDEEACDTRLTHWEGAARWAAWQVAEELLGTAVPGVVSGRRVQLNNGSEQMFRLSTAEAAFRRALGGILRRLPQPSTIRS
ncbi:type I-E CRISPR-associated protein Cse1/CasA [Streptomyces cyaneofuscatus]|uniref:type I-E CRISPR-associated protein Cse1/CasA n=1 Tax=Streptomyces cyaneofuscatus TaxID=66883 RepID=UPI0033B8121E